MARIAIFTDESGWHGEQLCHAFSKRGYTVQYVQLIHCQINLSSKKCPIYIPHFEKNLPDAVFVRGVTGGSLQEVVFYLDILHSLKTLGIPVYNDGYALEKSVDKGRTSFLLHHANIKTPLTWVLRDREQALKIATQQLNQGHQLITKPIFGSQGEGIRRLEKMTDLFWLTSSNGIYYLQQFIECEGRGYSDIRVFVIAGKATAAMRRMGKSWLNNVARGAKCEAVKLNPLLAEIAIKATYALGMDYAGVDIIQDKQGQYSVIEVNSIPAWKGLESVCHINIAELLATDLIERYLKND